MKSRKDKKTYTPREFAILLRNNGYTYDHSSGGHDIYVRDGKHISIASSKLNRMVARRLIKEYNLIRM